jgi:hypothetical protein
MPDLVQQIIDEFQRLGWEGTPMEQTTRLLAEDPPAEATRLVLASLGRIAKSTNFVDLAISFVPDTDISDVAAAAVRRFDADPTDENAASIISYLSLQSPPALHPHLSELLRLMPNAEAYYGSYPWRESGLLAFDELRRAIESSADDLALRDFAWSAMLETRTPQAIQFALQSYDAHRGGLYSNLDVNLPWVDHVRRPDGTIARCDGGPVMHLVFDDDYLWSDVRFPWTTIHPTWRIGQSGETIARAKFGGVVADGATCNCCGGPLHHLITLDPLPQGVHVTSVPRLALATCLCCLGYEVHPCCYYQHDAAAGEPRDITVTERRDPQFESGPLKETTVRLVATPRRWRWQDWAMSNDRENLHRVGGHPCWVQAADVPACPRCAEPMSFLMQFDSDLPTPQTAQFSWGSGGLAYVHWCDGCRVSATFWQCT